MTIEEMRRELRKYCGEFDLCVDGCRLSKPDDGSCIKYGIIAALTRLSDKWQRFETLILTKDPGTPDESIRDTLLDMANYCIMTVMELDQKEV